MNEKLVQRIATEVEEIEAAGLYKKERIIASQPGCRNRGGRKDSFEFLRQ